MVLKFDEIFGKQDDVDFINIFSLGRTKLGQLLSNFAHTPFVWRGKQFESVEGFWYWKVSGGDPKFYFVYGSEAKQRGKAITTRHPEPTREELKEVYLAKLLYNPHIGKLLRASKLPFAHYYQYDGPPITADKYLWTAEVWDEIRSQMSTNKYEALVGKTWYPIMIPFFNSPEFLTIGKKLKEYKDKGLKVQPDFQNVFNNLKNSPFDQVKVVLVLEIGVNKADNDKIADMLAAAIYEDTQADKKNIWKTTDCLLLPLNVTTVNGENHSQLWRPYTEHIVKSLQSNPGVLFCFIGKEAKRYIDYLDPITTDFYVIEHPMQAMANNRKWNHKGVFEKINRASKFLNDKPVW